MPSIIRITTSKKLNTIPTNIHSPGTSFRRKGFTATGVTGVICVQPGAATTGGRLAFGLNVADHGSNLVVVRGRLRRQASESCRSLRILLRPAYRLWQSACAEFFTKPLIQASSLRLCTSFRAGPTTFCANGVAGFAVVFEDLLTVFLREGRQRRQTGKGRCAKQALHECQLLFHDQMTSFFGNICSVVVLQRACGSCC